MERKFIDTFLVTFMYMVIKLLLDWKVVVMERLSPSLDAPSDYTAQLKTIVKYLHDKNYVHGDLHKPNIFNVNGKLQICDFDIYFILMQCMRYNKTLCFCMPAYITTVPFPMWFAL